MDSTQPDGAQATGKTQPSAGSTCPTMTSHPITGQLRRNRITLVAGLILIAATVVATIYTKRLADDRASLTPAEAQLAPTKVTVCSVVQQHVPIRIEVRGFLRGFIESSVYSEVAGRVIERVVSEGDTLQPDQVLCRIDDTFHRLAVEQAQARLQSAQADADKAQASVEMSAAQVQVVRAEQKQAQIEFDRIQSLFDRQTSPKIEHDRAETELQRASAASVRTQAGLRWATHQRRSAVAAVAQAQAQLEQANETLRRCTIRTSIAGQIDALLIEQGQYVTTGQRIADLVQLDRLKLIVEVDADKLALLRNEPAVQMVADNQPDRIYRATLHHIAPRANPVSRKFRIELQVDNPDGTLLAGMFAQARFDTSAPGMLLVLPSDAVFRRFGQEYCHVTSQEAGQLVVGLRAIQVRPVPQHRDLLQVVDGLTEGEQVVIDAQGQLRDGWPVIVVATDSGLRGLAFTTPGSAPSPPSPGG